MSKMDHEIPPPEGWPTGWVNRDLPELNTYLQFAGQILFCSALVVHIVRWSETRKLKKELQLATSPSDRASTSKKLRRVGPDADRRQFKIALAFMANTIVLTMVDGLIAIFVLAKDVSNNPDVWDLEMVMYAGLYVVFLFALFMASFVLFPYLQMLAVTWGLTRFSRKHNLSEYVPQARQCSSLAALAWSFCCFLVVSVWSGMGGTEMSTTRFVVLEAAWGSTLAWLEAAFLFNYLSQAIGNKELAGTSSVSEVSMQSTLHFLDHTDDIADCIALCQGREGLVHEGEGGGLASVQSRCARRTCREVESAPVERTHCGVVPLAAILATT